LQCQQSQSILNNLKLLLKQALVNYCHEKNNKIVSLRNKLPQVDTAKLHHRLEMLEYKLTQSFTTLFLDKKQTYEVLTNQLQLLNPEAILMRGYAIVRSADNKIVNSVKKIKAGDILAVTLADGKLETVVK
jgi:exodeoxyribonuclease VII large subunit